MSHFTNSGRLVSLKTACNLGDVELVKTILQRDSSLINDVIDDEGSTCLHKSVSRECQFVEITRLLLEFSHCDVNRQDNHGKTPLHYAVLYHSAENVKLLLSKNADVNIQDLTKSSPLDFAHISEDLEIQSLFYKFRNTKSFLLRKERQQKCKSKHRNLSSYLPPPILSPSILRKRKRSNDEMCDFEKQEPVFKKNKKVSFDDSDLV